jgi:hypothetical protein
VGPHNKCDMRQLHRACVLHAYLGDVVLCLSCLNRLLRTYAKEPSTSPSLCATPDTGLPSAPTPPRPGRLPGLPPLPTLLPGLGLERREGE